MNIKKILLILVISFFPLIIYANGPVRCCELKATTTFNGVEYGLIWVGEKGCDAEGAEIGTTICTKDVGGKATADCYTPKWGMICILSSVYTLINWIFSGLMVAVSLFTIWGAYDILTAAGDPEKVKKGRERIMYAMIGLVVALLSKAIPGLVEALIG